MPKNGQFYVGKGGFAFKKNTGSGVRRVLPLGLITGVPADVNTKFVYGSGVGALNISVRRAQLRHSTICTDEKPCGRFLSTLGIHPKNSGQAITFESGLGQLGLPYTQYYNSSSFNPIRQPNQVIIDTFNNIVGF